ncbi:MAG: VOC family protein [Chloroflexota bacterium]|nr:VOC family protein [Chloroflexota bacterium]
MPLVLAIPALPVQNIIRSVAYYSERLGFIARHQDTGFAILVRDAVELHVWEASDESWNGRAGAAPVVSGAESFIAGTASCRIQVVGVNELHAELQPRGVLHGNAPLTEQPWGTREFGVVDADGNLITFFERV